MRRFVTWAAASLIALLGIGHLLFALPNFGYASECPGAMLSFTGCMVLYEGVAAVIAGVSLIAFAVLLVRGRLLLGALVAAAGTGLFTLFFWFAAIPTELSDVVFGWLSLPAPVISLAIAAIAAVSRHRRLD
jgi:hypothetical protein